MAPKITLNYGNSPVGEIMKADNISVSNKLVAVADFEKNNKYSTNADYLPAGKTAGMLYSPLAWGGSVDPTVNLDRDATALFSFEYDDFIDPGFVAVDSLGNSVDPTDVRRSITVTVLPGQSIIVPDKDKKTNTFSDTKENPIANDLFTYANITGDATKVIQPDVYELTYSFYDNALAKTITNTRKVVILPLMGDTTLDGQISVGDLVPIKNYTANNFTFVDSTVKTSTYNLGIYRVMDTTSDTQISVGDLVPIKNHTANVQINTYYSTFTK